MTDQVGPSAQLAADLFQGLATWGQGWDLQEPGDGELGLVVLQLGVGVDSQGRYLGNGRDGVSLEIVRNPVDEGIYNFLLYFRELITRTI